MDIYGNEQNNMVSNLPLLFANGYPASLDKISEKQLENFIPFMVQCSLGLINIQEKLDCTEPEWWPEDIPFSIPFVKPREFEGDWLRKMKDIVTICYHFHKSTFLLRFCSELATLRPASLRFINNYNSTTSLYDRRNNKLLVTFRNENMSYDQPQRNRKSLLSKRSNDKSSQQQQLMVEPPLFDIYLCDHCDGEFYSFEAIKEHEKTCTSTADDEVIICDSPTLELSKTTANEKPNNELREAFLLNFDLQRKENNAKDVSYLQRIKNFKLKDFKIEDPDSGPIEKLKRLPRRNRGIYTLSRCSTIPLSSPAGQRMIKTSKTLMTDDYLYERLDRMERFCHAAVLAPGVNRPKFLDKKYTPSHVQCIFKKPSEYPLHTYVFPGRHFRSRDRTENFWFLNSLLLKRCRPFSIRLKRYTDEQIKRKIEKRRNYNNLKQMQLQQRSCEILDRRKPQIVIDTIDLCSSDDDDDANDVENEKSQTINPIRLVKSVNSLNRSSSSLTPLRTYEIANTSTNSAINNSTSTIVRTANHEDNKNLNKFEGNFLVSQTPKPLQPSVLLFSNYSMESSHHHPNHYHYNHFSHNSTNYQQQQQQQTITHDKLMQNYQNQENLQNNLQKTSEDVIMLSTASSSSNNITNINRTDRSSNNNNNPSSTTTTTTTKVLHQFMSSYRESRSSEVTINKINSPNRIVSIDLTL